MYQHILVAIDLLESDGAVLETASRLAECYQAQLTIIHVCEPHVTGYGEGTGKHHIANEMQLKQERFPRLHTMVKKIVGEKPLPLLLFGQPEEVIHDYCDEHSCDLIVVGSHGYSGIKALLGSIANKVLHGAKCDVYTVRID